MGFGIKSVFLFLFFFILKSLYSQEGIIQREKLTYSWGIGREHAGLGLNILYYPKGWNLGVFGAAGYPVVGLSYNIGLKYRFYFESKKIRITPYFAFAYGYHNAFVVRTITYNEKYSKILYGSSISVGIDTGPKISKKHYMSFGINYGLNKKEADNYGEFLETLGYRRLDDNIPVSFVIGLRFVLD